MRFVEVLPYMYLRASYPLFSRPAFIILLTKIRLGDTTETLGLVEFQL